MLPSSNTQNHSRTKSLSTLSRWLKDSWISRLGLFWRQELTESSKKKTSPQLQVEALEQKAVCMDMMGAVKAGAMGLGLAALAGPLATPVEVTMKGWGAGQSTPAPKDQQSSKGKQLTPDDSDEFFTRHSLTDPGAITIVPPTKPEQEGGGSSDETTSQQEPPQPARDLEDLQMVSVLEPDAEEDQWLTEVDQALQGEAPRKAGQIVGPNDVGAGGGGSAGGGGGTESSPPQFNTNSGATTTSRSGGGSSSGGATDPLRRGGLGGNPGGQLGGFNQNGGGNGGALPGGEQSSSSQLLLGGEGQQSQQSLRSAPPPTLAQGYSSRPLAFEVNKGQVDSSVHYLARGSGYNIYLTSTEMVLTLNQKREPTDAEIRERPELEGERVRVQDVVRIQLSGADSTSPLVGQELLKSRSNYFIDSATNLALTDIANYQQVLARNVYDGIDVRYQEQGGELRFDFEVAPGADLSEIRLNYQGVANLHVDDQGQLHLGLTSGQSVVQQAPVIYQDVEGERQQRTGRYLQRENGQIGFAVDSYDDSRALIIDPTLNYTAFIGGSGNDVATDVAVDHTGSVYLAGYTESADFPTENPYQSTLPGSSSYFITRLSPDGSEVIYSTYLDNYVANPGSNAISLAVDLGGYAYLAGTTSNASFPTQNAYQDSLQGSYDAFVTKLSPAGNALVYSTYLGGTDGDGATGIAVDGAGRAYVTGHTSSTDFDIEGGWQTSFGGNSDAFVTRLDSDGGGLGYSSYLGGSNIEEAYDVAVDVQGRAYVTGWTQSSDFTTTTAAYDTTLGGVGDAFVTRINSAGDAVEYSTFLGGDSDQGMGEEGRGIDVDSQGRAYVTGFVDGASDFPTSLGAYDTTLSSTDAAFVTRLNSDGTDLSYSTFLEGTDGYTQGYDIVVNGDEEAWVVGGTDSTSFPTESALQSGRAGNQDAFITRLNSSGTGLGYSSYWGYSSNDEAYAVALDWEGDPVVAGYAQPDDQLAQVLIRNSITVEGDSGSTASNFVVELSEELTTTVTVEWSTSGYTATSNTDFTAASGTLTFAPGETTKTITVDVLGDTELESDEIYYVTLDNVSGAHVDAMGNYAGTGVITEDDEDAPYVYVHDSWITEGDSGTSQAIVDVRLTKAGESAITVPWQTNDGSATTSNSDYVGASGTLTFSAGEVRKTISVTVNGDTNTGEYDEYFTVDLSSPSGATIADGSGTVNLLDDDDTTVAPTVMFGGHAWISEGDSGTDQIVFPIRLSQSSGSTITAQWSTSDSSATTADDDYESASGTLTFTSGQVEKLISVDVNGDTKDEFGENFDLNLSSPSGATIETNSSTLYGYLTDPEDSHWPWLKVSDLMMMEPETGTDQAVLTVTLDRTSSETLEVTWSTYVGTAVPGDDYTSASGTLTFSPGQTTKTISVDVKGDGVPEGTEYFTINLSTSDDLHLLDSAPDVLIVEPLRDDIEHGPGGNSDAFVLRFEGAGSRPGSPVITSITDDTGTLTTDQITLDQTLVLSGTASANATVTLYKADSGQIGTTVANSSGEWSYDYTGTSLPQGIHAFDATQTVAGATSLRSATFRVTVDTTPPDVTLDIDTTTHDFSPELEVVARDNFSLDSDATAFLDVDLDNDGNFTDPGETAHTTFTLSEGVGLSELAALSSTGTIRVRARVTDTAGNEGTSAVTTVTVDSQTSWSPSNATRNEVDALQGDFLSQAGIWQTYHLLDLDDSPGTARSGDGVLAYTSGRVDVQPIVAMQLQSPNNAALPATLTAKLYWNGSGTADSTTNFSTSGYDKGEIFTIAMQKSSAVSTTGRYTYKLEVTDGTNTWSITDALFVVAEDSSALGAGWTFGNVDRFLSVGSQSNGTYTFAAGMLRIYGTGGHSFYTDDGMGGYTSPAGDNGTLETYTPGTTTYYRYTTPDGFQQDFEHANGTSEYYLTKEISSDAHETIEYSYDGSHRLDGIITDDGELTTLTYSSGKLSTIQTGTRTTTFTVTSGDLVKIENPDGGVRTLTYNADSRLTKDEFANLVGSVSYDASGLVDSFTVGDHNASEDEGVTTALTPAMALGLGGTLYSGDVRSNTTDARGVSTQQELDTSGRVTRMLEANGAVTRWNRDGNGWATVMQDSLNNVTSYTLDGDGDVTGVTFADSTTESYTYTTISSTYKRLATFTDQGGSTWTYTYYSDGLLKDVEDPLNNFTTWTYYTAGTSDGLVQDIKDARENFTTFTYDSQRRLHTITSPNGDVTTFTYDSNGNQQTITDPRTNVISYVRDAFGRITELTDAASEVWEYVYNGAGLLTAYTDAEGNENQLDLNSRGQVSRSIQAKDSSEQITNLSVFSDRGEVVESRNANANWWETALDAVGQAISSTDPLGNVSQTRYDLAGRVTSFFDELGRGIETAYDSLNRITSVTDPQGNSDSFGYDNLGRVTTVTNVLGQKTVYEYDALHRVTTITQAQGTADERTRTMEYDGVDNLIEETDWLGRITAYDYDDQDRVTSITQADGTTEERTSTFLYDVNNNLTSTTDWIGRVTNWTYNDRNQLETLTEAAHTMTLSRTTTFLYDGVGNPTETIDALGRRHVTTFDSLNRATGFTEGYSDPLARTTTQRLDAVGNSIGTITPGGKAFGQGNDQLSRGTLNIDPLGNFSQSYVDAVGRTLGMTDPLGNSSSLGHDSLDRVTSSTDALGNESALTYDDLGNVLTMEDARGNVFTFTYDHLNRQVTREDAEGNVTTTIYDDNDNVTSVEDAANGTWTYTYDNLDRRRTVEDPDNNVFTTNYDLADRVTSTVAPGPATTTYDWDDLDRLVAEEDSLGKTVTYLYDKLDNLTGVIDPEGNRTTFILDNLNRVVEEVDPFGNTLTLDYDDDDQLVSRTDRLGRERSFEYDLNGRVIEETWLNGTVTVDALSYAFDKAGNLTSAGDGDGTYTYSYDAAHRVTNVEGLFGLELTFTYDGVGNRTKVEDNFGGVISSTFDDNNLLTKREFDDGSTELRFDLTYNSRNQMETITRYSTLAGTKVGETIYGYDGQGRLENINHRNGASTTISEFTYTYDARSRVESKERDATTNTYVYDSRSQLTDDGVASYTYDDNGNRNMSGYQTGTGNRMTNDGTFTYTYDSEGNTTKKSKGASDETWVYEWDHRNQLTQIEKQATDGGTVELRVEYEYDVFGRRIQEDKWTSAAGTVTTKFGYDGNNVWVDLDGSNNLQTRYVRPDGVDALAARVDSGGNVYWYLTGRLGSVIAVTNGSGTIVDQIYYDGFGNIISETSPANGGRLKFTGKEWDPDTGLQYNFHRYYNPLTGTWMSPDPIGFRAGDANLYRYVGNNPTNLTDPDGLWGRGRGRRRNAQIITFARPVPGGNGAVVTSSGNMYYPKRGFDPVLRSPGHAGKVDLSKYRLATQEEYRAYWAKKFKDRKMKDEIHDAIFFATSAMAGPGKLTPQEVTKILDTPGYQSQGGNVRVIRNDLRQAVKRKTRLAYEKADFYAKDVLRSVESKLPYNSKTRKLVTAAIQEKNTGLPTYALVEVARYLKTSPGQLIREALGARKTEAFEALRNVGLYGVFMAKTPGTAPSPNIGAVGPIQNLKPSEVREKAKAAGFIHVDSYPGKDGGVNEIWEHQDTKEEIHISPKGDKNAPLGSIGAGPHASKKGPKGTHNRARNDLNEPLEQTGATHSEEAHIPLSPEQ